jgi:hypothetical protein
VTDTSQITQTYTFKETPNWSRRTLNKATKRLTDLTSISQTIYNQTKETFMGSFYYKVWIKLNGRLYGILAKARAPEIARAKVLEKYTKAEYVETVQLGAV